MGEEIQREQFGEADFKQFGQKLAEETKYAASLFSGGGFSQSGYSIGFEIEAWLLDHNYFPTPINETYLKTLSQPLVVPELSRFNVEMNCTPLALEGHAFMKALDELTMLWAQCQKVAHRLDANIVLIGTLPTIRDEDLSLDNMSPLKRYHALNNEVLRQRHGRPMRLEIDGRDRLVSEHRDTMLEAGTTSFQIHLKTPGALAHRYYNASVMASGPVMAMSTNAPFLFERDLWDETRIPLFEQAIQLAGLHPTSNRVSFGNGYLRESLFPWVEENLKEFPVLLPLVFDEPTSKLSHVHLHNGTIWRWNRPLIGFEDDGTPHLRIEHRIMPAGPSFLDMMANAAFYIGLAKWIVDNDYDRKEEPSFAEARANFYDAARHGLDAMLRWRQGRKVSAGNL
ncbi:MAG TPA: hypothetical protein VI565_10535, partial [Burkholderiales bacterium]|nr:hypothetical protein [Burkholderiales bacterium]